MKVLTPTSVILLTNGLRDVAHADVVAPDADDGSVSGRHGDVDGLEGLPRGLAKGLVADRRHPAFPDGAVDCDGARFRREIGA